MTLRRLLTLAFSALAATYPIVMPACLAKVTLRCVSEDWDYQNSVKAYVSYLNKTVQGNWNQLGIQDPRRAAVMISINNEGGVSRFRITESSGDSSFDDLIIRTIYQSSPYSPPPIAPGSVLTLTGTFDSAEPSPSAPAQQNEPVISEQTGEQNQEIPELVQPRKVNEAGGKEAAERLITQWSKVGPQQAFGIQFTPSPKPRQNIQKGARKAKR